MAKTTDEIAWTPKLRGKTFATRARPNPLHLTGGHEVGPMWVSEHIPYPYTLDAAWPQVLDRTWGFVEWAQPPNSVIVGYASATPELAALARRAREAFGQRLDELDADVEAAMLTLGLRASWNALPLWVARHGVVFATRAMLRMSRLRRNERESGIQREVGLYLIEDGVAAGHEVHEHATAWKLLRGVLAVASDADFAEARAIADAARGDLPPAAHAAVAFAFADRAWCRDAITALVAEDARDNWTPWQMMMATADRDDALSIAKEPYRLEEEYALTMLAEHGAATIPIIVAAFGVGGRVERLRVLGDTLALIRTRDALEAFVPMLGVPAVKVPLGRAFKAQPDEAARLLAGPAMKDDKAGKHAAAVLAKL